MSTVFVPHRHSLFLLVSVVVALAAGCEQGARRLSLDRSLARDSFVTALESWKQGEHPSALRERSPGIVVGDHDWESGRRLILYRLLDGETDDGTNLHATVELVLRDGKGRERKQQVTYIVGTSPVITIFRK